MLMPALVSAALLVTSQSGDSRADLERDLEQLTRARAVDENCDLFSEADRQALNAGITQATEALIRDGVAPEAIAIGVTRIRTDRSLAVCDSQTVQDLAAMTRAAMTQYAWQPSNVFRGPTRRWAADRTQYDFVTWPLVQEVDTARFGRAFLGTGTQRESAVALAWRSEVQPVTVMIVVRDQARAPRPYDQTLGGLFQPPQGNMLARYSAPAYAERRILASGRIAPVDAARLLPADAADTAPVRAVRFPASTLQTLAALDPAEAARIDLLGADGRVISQMWIEIGPLREALDFSTLPYDPTRAPS